MELQRDILTLVISEIFKEIGIEELRDVIQANFLKCQAIDFIFFIRRLKKRVKEKQLNDSYY